MADFKKVCLFCGLRVKDLEGHYVAEHQKSEVTK